MLQLDPLAWAARFDSVAGGSSPPAEAPPREAWGAVARGVAWETWRTVCDPAADERALMRLAETLGGEGPFRPVEESLAIEVWVDDELSLLHAAWRLARRLRRDALGERCFRAARWHLEHTGAENATHRPWGAHVFIAEGSAEAVLYADSLLHAVLAGGGLEGVSRWILTDAAAELRLWAAAR